MLKRKIMMLRLLMMTGGYRKAAYLKKKNYFYHQGEHCFFTPYNYGTEPYLLSFGDNVYVATGVRFVTHDVAAKMFHQMEQKVSYTSRVGAIEIGNNVFIGAGATILYDVKVEDNVIIAAGTLVNKPLAGGAIYAGVPAKKIGNFDDYKKQSKEYSKIVPWTDTESFRVRREKQIEYSFLSKEKGVSDAPIL